MKPPSIQRLLIACIPWLLTIGLCHAQSGNSELTGRVVEQQEQLRNTGGSGAVRDDTQNGKNADAESAAGLSTAEILPSLNGVRLVGDPKQISATVPVQFDTPKVVAVDGFSKVPSPPPSVLDSVQDFLGRPVSLASLEEMTQALIESYRNTDYPLVDIYLPPQNVSNGVVQLVVLEATLGELAVEGTRNSDPEFLKRQMRIAPGERINRIEVEENLSYLNENPFRRVDLIYRRGSAEATSDILLTTEDMKPIQVSAQWGNTGTILTGENEYSLGATWGMIGGTEQLLSYNFTTDESFQNLQAHSLFYQLPLENRDVIQLIGAYVTSEGALDLLNVPLGVTGENTQLTAEYFHRLPAPMRRANHKLFLATDYKTTNNNLIFGGSDLLQQEAMLLHFRTGYEFTLRDDHGYTTIETSAVASPGNLSSNNTDEAFGALREGAESDYWYALANLERVQQLPAEFLLRIETRLQYSDQPLLSTEQLLAGGYRTLRGLSENAVRGDRGIQGQVELLTPEFPILPGFGDRLRFLAFVDGANLTQLNASVNGSGDQNVGVVTGGAGFSYRIGTNVSARLSYGHILHEYGLDDEVDEGRFHFGISVSY